jgi:DNA-binding transcriptional ArsR family regulator
VVDLAADLPISRPAVSKHLRLLTEAGLVTATVRGRERHYAVTPDGLAPVADLVAELSAERAAERAGPATAWPVDTSALDALETEVRRTGRDRRTAEPAAATHPQHHEETA